MVATPVERNAVTRFILGLAVIWGLTTGAYLGASLLIALGVPYGAWIGTGIGTVAAFLLFAAWYTNDDASFDSE